MRPQLLHVFQQDLVYYHIDWLNSRLENETLMKAEESY